MSFRESYAPTSAEIQPRTDEGSYTGYGSAASDYYGDSYSQYFPFDPEDIAEAGGGQK